MLTQFRLAAASAALLGAAWAGTAFAQWPSRQVARLEPGYGGVCEECDLSGRILVGARMTHSVFNRSNFTHAVLTRANASNSAFEHADFSNADLSGAKLIDTRCTGAVFASAVLINSDASRADLANANFSRADVTRMIFDGANLSGADLRNARGLTQTQLNHACGDRRTRLPRGMRVRMCR